ncbi:MAG: class I SAM-dependent methyltransferase [Endozoicomonas sp.]|uniref:class I SAM-dependent methyltransferase n=1 Tax=Endozoicomonas sp. TaxID=1892382 RepID=UPI003D9AFED9
MGHQQLMQITAQKLQQHFANEAVHLLGLGCGDASLTAKMTRELSLASYTAVDLVESVLAMARQNMTRPDLEIHFFQSNIFEPLPVKSSYNLVFSSFAIHHGSLEEKQALFSEIRKRAEPGCPFFMIDAIRLEDQSRDQYLESVSQYFKGISVLEGDWQNFVLEHVNQFDFPESVEQFREIGEQTQWQLMDHHILEELPDYPVALMSFQAK